MTEPVKYTIEDRVYLKSIRHSLWPQSHPNLVWIRQRDKDLKLMGRSVIYGHCYFPSVHKKGVGYSRDHHETQPNDVFVTSYPRSGTHWTMKICLEIIRHCAYNPDSLPPEYRNADYRYIPHFESMVSKPDGINILNQFVDRYNIQYPSLRFTFSHCPFRLFPAKKVHPRTKIIHIVREAKDTFVSVYNLMLSLENSFNKNNELVENIEDVISFDDVFQDIMNGVIMGGNWWDTLIEWYLAAQKKDNNILFIYYEDIIENPKQMIQKIAQFLAKDEGEKYLDQRLINDDDILDQIVKQCTFANQKKTVKRGWKFIFRKGKIGDWKNYFNDKQRQQMDNMTRIKFHGMNAIPYYSDNIIRSML